MPLPPLHPALVHFPIAFLLAAGVLELAALGERERWSAFGFASLTAGVVGAALAVASGFPAEDAATNLDPAGETAMALHHTLSFTTAGLAAALWLVRWRWEPALRATAPRRRVYAAGMIVLMACLVASAYFGGQLVYEHGVGTTAKPTARP